MLQLTLVISQSSNFDSNMDGQHGEFLAEAPHEGKEEEREGRDW